MDLFFEIHSRLPREAPGDDGSTEKAFDLIPALPSRFLALDIGCGPGAQTLVLARRSQGSVIALDNHLPFLRELQKRAESAGLENRIQCMNGSMFNLPFPEESFDLIWSEGAVYIMGFENGLRNWRRVLKRKGFLAVTEICWIRENPSREVLEFWREAYPEMRSLAQNADLAEASGFELLGSFVLPESSWWKKYYTPLEERISLLRKKYRGNAEAQALLDQESREITLFRNDPGNYGYAFFVMRKNQR